MLRVVVVPQQYSPWETVQGGDAEETLAIDWKHKAPGRGAHVCLETACLKRALGGGFRRSFRKGLRLPGEEELMSAVREGLRRNFKERLSLARRAGRVSSGESAVSESVKQGRCRLLLLAREMSAGQQEKYKRNAERKGLPVSTSLSGEEMGEALRREFVGIMSVEAEPFAGDLQRMLAQMVSVGHLANF